MLSEWYRLIDSIGFIANLCQFPRVQNRGLSRVWLQTMNLVCSCLTEQSLCVGQASRRSPSEACFVCAGHPEFSREFMEALVQWKAQATPDTFPPELAEAAIMELKQDAVSSSDEESWHQLCKAFLKYQVPA